jgi:phosphoribosylamine--glycine ligase
MKIPQGNLRVLILGSGGREDSLAWKIAKSPLVSEVFVAPGNGGTHRYAKPLDVKLNDHKSVIGLIKQHGIHLTVVGPEAPLCDGIVDSLSAKGLPVFGPTRKAAHLEGSKIFAKEVMNHVGVPTANHRVFKRLDRALASMEGMAFPSVIKEDGLAAGKGVTIARSAADAETAFRAALKTDPRQSGFQPQVLVEDFLDGEELSVLALVDGNTIVPLASSQDHKRVGDGDSGPNTGGMGAYSPAPVLTDALSAQIDRDVLVPVVQRMNAIERPFRGLLYAGLMITQNGPQVMEFNVRFGDPECQALILRMKSDIVPLLIATIQGTLDDCVVEWDPRPSVCVVMAARGYPDAPITGMPIRGLDKLDESDDLRVFHAGTRKDGDQIVVSGGRVLGVTALGTTIADARDRAYAAVKKIRFDGAHYRTDIAHRALARQK